jgi:hypothetical protein
MQEEVGGRRQIRNRKKEGRRHDTGKIRKMGALTGRNRQEDTGGSRKQETKKQQAGGRQEA